MKKQFLLGCLLAASCSVVSQDWPAIQPEARPSARWWWLGSAVDKENLTYNLEEYAKAGLGAMEITPIYGVQGNDRNNIPYLTPQWMDILQHTQAEGKSEAEKLYLRLLLVTDYICGMTDSYAKRLYQEMNAIV